MRRMMLAGCCGWLVFLVAGAAPPGAPELAPPPLPAVVPPPVLNPPQPPSPSEGFTPAEPAVLDYPVYPPLGFTGKSSVVPIEEATDEVRTILQARKAALGAVAQRLMEKEVIDGDELHLLLEQYVPGPKLVPGSLALEERRAAEAALETAPTERLAEGGPVNPG